MKSKQNITVTVDVSVLEGIDAQRGLVKRSTFVNNLLAGLVEKRKDA
jgi:hypothetical protein